MPRRTSQTGSELFIVDNSEDDWKVYCLREYIGQYKPDMLVETLHKAVARGWQTRDDATEAATRYLGFRRTGSTIRQRFKSAINAALRRKLIEKDGLKYIRKAR